MKKKVWLISVIAAIALGLILFLPIPQGTYDDGGTREYNALTYKIVKWNKITAAVDENGQTIHNTYRNTSVFWYPNNQKTLDELWQIEKSEAGLDLPQQAEGNQLLPEGHVISVEVSSLPEGYEYSFGKEDAKAIVEYLSGLNLTGKFEENPDKYTGMTWVISLKYENGDSLEVYHSCNMFVRSEHGSWYKMTYEEASRFDSLLDELSN